MTDSNLYKMPWSVESDRAAGIIKSKLAQRKSEFIFPCPYPAVGWALSVLPGFVVDFFTELK
jgi:hypothetical protein